MLGSLHSSADERPVSTKLWQHGPLKVLTCVLPPCVLREEPGGRGVKLGGVRRLGQGQGQGLGLGGLASKCGTHYRSGAGEAGNSTRGFPCQAVSGSNWYLQAVVGWGSALGQGPPREELVLLVARSV